MKLEPIKYFVGVAQSNSISAAAKKLKAFAKNMPH